MCKSMLYGLWFTFVFKSDHYEQGWVNLCIISKYQIISNRYQSFLISIHYNTRTSTVTIHLFNYWRPCFATSSSELCQKSFKNWNQACCIEIDIITFSCIDPTFYDPQSNLVLFKIKHHVHLKLMHRSWRTCSEYDGRLTSQYGIIFSLFCLSQFGVSTGTTCKKHKQLSHVFTETRTKIFLGI